jgi:glycosyltransferase involved in cell wall biosynthesis
MRNYHRAADPVVSIGMPVFNGSNSITRAIESLLNQTYTNFELIISDNCSTDNTWDILLKLSNKDDRIKLFHQSKNIGAYQNFNFVLKKAKGDFFMWAAADDLWDHSFIEKIMDEFQISDNNIQAIMSETQYSYQGKFLDFFSEGSIFYNYHSTSTRDRIKFLLKNNYGNLWYSIFRRDALFFNNQSILDLMTSESTNEIFLFIFIAYRGNWRILHQILFFKEVKDLHIYEQAAWEKTGGTLRNPRKHVSTHYLNFKYHLVVINQIHQTLKYVDLPPWEKIEILVYAVLRIMFHLISLTIGWKL